MATNRSRKARTRKKALPLDDTITRFLLYGKAERDTPAWSLKGSHFFDDSRELIRETWETYRDALMPLWKKSGNPGVPWGDRYIQDPSIVLYDDDDND